MKDNYDLTELIKKKKKRKNSKVKGNTFENKVAGILNLRFNTEEFCRTPGSGAFATTHKLPEHLKVFGDLITPKDFEFVIECKKGYNKEGISSLFKSNSIIYDFIDQAERDSEKSGKEFLVIIGQDRQPIIAIVSNRILNGFVFDYKITVKRLGKEYAIVLLDDLLKLSQIF